MVGYRIATEDPSKRINLASRRRRGCDERICSSTETILVDSHAHGGIHADFF